MKDPDILYIHAGAEMTQLRHEDRVVVIAYTNWRGEHGERRVVPHRIWYGSTEWHPEPQWMLDAHDLDRDADRSFAMADIHTWRESTLDVRAR